MNVSHVAAALRRRWLIIVVLLLATGGAAGWVYTTVPFSYQAQATMIVLLPNENNDGSGSSYPVNPYLNVGAASSQVAASALASISASEDFLAALQTDGVTSTTSVEVASYGGGVVLVLTATGDDAVAVRSDLSTVSAQISTELTQRQTNAGAPDGTFLTASDLTTASPAVVLAGDRNKLAAVTAVIGLLDTVAAVIVAEAIGRRRAARRGSAGGSPATADTGGRTRRSRAAAGAIDHDVLVESPDRTARDRRALDDLAGLDDIDGLDRAAVAATARGSRHEPSDSRH